MDVGSKCLNNEDERINFLGPAKREVDDPALANQGKRGKGYNMRVSNHQEHWNQCTWAGSETHPACKANILTSTQELFNDLDLRFQKYRYILTQGYNDQTHFECPRIEIVTRNTQ